MAKPTRLTIAKDDIFAYFDAAPWRVFTEAQLSGIVADKGEEWRLAKKTTAADFIGFLTRHDRLKRHDLRSDAYGKQAVRYSWGDASVYELALSLRRGAYLSHGTAVFLHGLTDLIPKTIYLNAEQTPKPAPRGGLTQAALTRAFAGNQRRSNFSYAYDEYAITVINGKNTDRLGVEDLIGPSSEHLDVTDIERTLIDIVVRPAYAGGVFHVLQAYRSAKDQTSVNRLTAYLAKLDYVYPYHQAIGFLMQRAGYAPSLYEMLREPGIKFDFYLAHGLRDPDYDGSWRLFFPRDFEA